MTPLLLLVLELPADARPPMHGWAPCGEWQDAAAWAAAGLASALTGTPLAAHGVVSELELRPDGQQLRAAPRRRLMQPPLWERVAGALAVGVPWSIDSTGRNLVVSPEFASPDVPDGSPRLPGRVHPATLAPALDGLRLRPDELDAATVAGLGFRQPGAHRPLAALLSTHAMATALLADTSPPFAVVRLKLTMPPTESAATAAFIAALIERYDALCPAHRRLVLLRSDGVSGVDNRLFATPPAADLRIVGGLALGQYLATLLGLSAAADSLPDAHWRALDSAYRPPDATLPGTREAIAAVRAHITTVLAARRPGE